VRLALSAAYLNLLGVEVPVNTKVVVKIEGLVEWVEMLVARGLLALAVDFALEDLVNF